MPCQPAQFASLVDSAHEGATATLMSSATAEVPWQLLSHYAGGNEATLVTVAVTSRNA